MENGLPWAMEMVFRDAECRLRKERAPAQAPCVSSVKLPDGTTTSSQASSRNDPLTRFPWRGKQDRFVFTPSYPMGSRSGLARGGLARTFKTVAKFAQAVQIDAGRLAVDAPLANRVRSGRKQP